MNVHKLPTTATVRGVKFQLQWEVTNNLAARYAEVPSHILRAWEKDPTVNMNQIVDELTTYGDYARYGQDRSGATWLCLYIKA